MPWDIDTYAGVEIYDPADGGRIGMRQLMIAINQREAAIGDPETEWMLPDGTEKTQPDLTDLIGADVRVGSTIKTNCERIRSAILALMSATHGPDSNARVFVESSESDTYWTSTSMNTAIGQTYVASVGPQHTLFLQNSKDILDRLIYVRLEINDFGSPSGTRYYNTTAQASWNAAWGGMTSEPVSLPSSSKYATDAVGPASSNIWLGTGGGTGTAGYSTWVIDDGDITVDLSPYSGLMTRAVFSYIHIFGGNWNDVLDVDFGGISLTTDSSSGQYVDIDSILTGPGFSDNIDFSLSSIGGSISPLGEFATRFRVGHVIVYIELAGILSDQ